MFYATFRCAGELAMKPYRLTVNDKLLLRRMMAAACMWEGHMSTQYEKVLAKIVPLGPVKKRPTRTS